MRGPRRRGGIFRTAADVEQFAGGPERLAGYAGAVVLEIRRGDRAALARELGEVLELLGGDGDALALWAEERTPLAGQAVELILEATR